jgi:hypothetical protein
VWETYRSNEDGPPSRGLKAAVGGAGGSFRPPTEVFRGFIDSPARVALAPTGEAVAVWSSSDQIHAATRRPRGRFGPSVLVGSGFEPEVGIDGRGTALAVWTRAEGGEFFTGELFVHAARRAPGGTFGAGGDLAPVGRDCTRHRGCASEVSVAVEANGDAVAAWRAHVNGGGVPGDSYLQAAEYATRSGG